MKPIKICIEGYKITIEEDIEGTNASKDKEPESIKYVPYPVVPTIPTAPITPQPTDYPYVTWTNADVFNIDNTSGISVVRDCMIGNERK